MVVGGGGGGGHAECKEFMRENKCKEIHGKAYMAYMEKQALRTKVIQSVYMEYMDKL